MDEIERTKLDAALERSWAQAQAGKTRPLRLLAESPQVEGFIRSEVLLKRGDYG